MGCVGSDPSAALDPWNGRHTGLALDEATMSLALIATDAWVARLVCRAFRDGCPREPQSGVERPACRAFRDGGPHGPARAASRRRSSERAGPSASAVRPPECAARPPATGRLDVLRWAWSRGMRAVRAIPEAAARGGHLATLEWLHARKCTSENVCLEAAAAGHIHVLEWARDHEHTWRRDFSSAAARNGHVGVLQWIRANGLTWDCVIYEAAAAGGRVNVLSWLASEGYVEHCALTNNVCENAARGPPPGGPEVGARARVPVGTDVLPRVVPWPPGAPAVGVCPWMRPDRHDWAPPARPPVDGRHRPPRAPHLWAAKIKTILFSFYCRN